MSYCQSVKEYLALGQMKKLVENSQLEKRQQFYFLPHHTVKRENSSTTKLCVVLDASSKTTSGKSLNDISH